MTSEYCVKKHTWCKSHGACRVCYKIQSAVFYPTYKEIPFIISTSSFPHYRLLYLRHFRGWKCLLFLQQQQKECWIFVFHWLMLIY